MTRLNDAAFAPVHPHRKSRLSVCNLPSSGVSFLDAALPHVGHSQPPRPRCMELRP